MGRTVQAIPSSSRYLIRTVISSGAHVQVQRPTSRPQVGPLLLGGETVCSLDASTCTSSECPSPLQCSPNVPATSVPPQRQDGGQSLCAWRLSGEMPASAWWPPVSPPSPGPLEISIIPTHALPLVLVRGAAEANQTVFSSPPKGWASRKYVQYCLGRNQDPVTFSRNLPGHGNGKAGGFRLRFYYHIASPSIFDPPPPSSFQEHRRRRLMNYC